MNRPVLGGSLPCALQVGATQDGRVAAARLVNVDVLGFSREQLIDGGLTQRGGARPVTLRVGLHLREWGLDPPTVLVAFLGMLVMLVGLPFFRRFLSAGARMDMGDVEHVGLRQAAQLELHEDSF